MTGGHVTPALAVIDDLQKMHPEANIIFVGRKFNNNREQSLSFEYQEVTRRNIPFFHLRTGRLTRSFSCESVMNVLSIPLGFFFAYRLLISQKPDVVLSFGGYLALPIAMVANWLGIPVYTHEQTIHPGVANQQIARIAKRIFISFPESSVFFPKDKVVLTGNPIRKSIFKQKSIPGIPAEPQLPCIYVTGGSLGAHALNIHIEHIIEKLVQSYIVIHQTGNVQEFKDYERLCQLRSRLPQEVQDRYMLKTHVSDEEVGYIFEKASLVISRSGANTFFELIALEKPAILVPLPLAAFDEQMKQARILKKAGAAELFNQNGDSDELFRLIQKVMSQRDTYAKSFGTLKKNYIRDASQRIIEELVGKTVN